MWVILLYLALTLVPPSLFLLFLSLVCGLIFSPFFYAYTYKVSLSLSLSLSLSVLSFLYTVHNTLSACRNHMFVYTSSKSNISN